MAQGCRLARSINERVSAGKWTLALAMILVCWGSPAGGDDDVYEWDEEGTLSSAVLTDELAAVQESETNKAPSQPYIEPTPVQPSSFAGEVIDPSTVVINPNTTTGGSQFQMGSLGQASVYGGNGSLGARLLGNYGTNFIQDVTAGVFGNQNQTVYNGGSTLRLYDSNNFMVMTRGLFGVVDDTALGNTNFTFSVDSYAGFRVDSYGGGEHWFKAGGFVDQQNHFGKAGPMFAALLFANEAFPITIDGALGFGYGDQVDRLPQSTNVIDVADRDYQLRVGTFLSPTWQVGFSSMIAEWGKGEDNRAWGLGAYTNVLLFQRSMVRLDFTTGDEGFRGYAMLSYLFGGVPSNTSACGECRVDGKSWAAQPINRDVALQLRSRNVPLVDRLNVYAQVISPPRQAICSGDNDGIVEAGECFELELYAENPTVVTVTNVQLGQNPTASGTANANPVGISGATFAQIAPGQTVQTNQLTDINIQVPASAATGSTIFVSFDLTIDGVTRRMTVGPVVVGQTTSGTRLSAN